jgi:hypothetical protein
MNAPQRIGAAILLMAGFATGCHDESDPSSRPSSPSATSPAPSPSPSPQPSPTTGGSTGCPNETTALAGARGRVLRGDLDGTGGPETVSLATDRSGAPGCQAFVSVESGTVTGVVAIDEPQISFDLGLPALDSIAPVGFGAGDEVVIVVSSGASTQFFTLVTVFEGEPVQVTVQDGPFGNLFPYGGSAAHLESSDCGRPSEGDFDGPLIVISSATAAGNDFRIERTFFAANAPELEPETTESGKVSFEELVSYPEFGEAPFAHCD